jgi:TfoX/Sxy family transcriptional regulator of competence genes
LKRSEETFEGHVMNKTLIEMKGGVEMASTKDYLDFILEQLSGLDEISYRAMMGEYVLYYRGKVFGGIYDDRFLVKPTKSAKAMMPDADMELPYEGAKEMILVDDVDNREFLKELVEAMYEELPAPKKK